MDFCLLDVEIIKMLLSDFHCVGDSFSRSRCISMSYDSRLLLLQLRSFVRNVSFLQIGKKTAVDKVLFVAV